MSQYPGQVSYTSSKYVNQLPVEIAGWLMREVTCESDNPSVLVVTSDRTCLLGCGIFTRGPQPGCTVTIGLSHLGQSTEDLTEMDNIIATCAIPMAKETDKLVPIAWDHDRRDLFLEKSLFLCNISNAPSSYPLDGN